MPGTTAPPAATSVDATTDKAAASELEALKSRVRGLEARVEELYKSHGERGSSARSPRRRGKRKTSYNSTQAAQATVDDVGAAAAVEEQFGEDRKSVV